MHLPTDIGRERQNRGGCPAQVPPGARQSSAKSEAPAYRGWEAKSGRRTQRRSWPRRSLLFAALDRAPGCECLQSGLSVLTCSVLCSLLSSLVSALVTRFGFVLRLRRPIFRVA